MVTLIGRELFALPLLGTKRFHGFPSDKFGHCRFIDRLSLQNLNRWSSSGSEISMPLVAERRPPSMICWAW